MPPTLFRNWLSVAAVLGDVLSASLVVVVVMVCVVVTVEPGLGVTGVLAEVGGGAAVPCWETLVLVGAAAGMAFCARQGRHNATVTTVTRRPAAAVTANHRRPWPVRLAFIGVLNVELDSRDNLAAVGF